MSAPHLTVGFVPGDRPVFSQQWALDMRDRTVDALKGLAEGALEMSIVLPDESSTTKGLVSDINQAEHIARQFIEAGVNRLLLGTMNFGDEEALSEVARRLHATGASVMLFGTHDGVNEDGSRVGSDSFCGTLSASMNLHMAGVPFNFNPCTNPDSEGFAQAVAAWLSAEPADVAGDCAAAFTRAYLPPEFEVAAEHVDAAVSAFRDVRFGQFGPRAQGFVTCAYDERQMLRQFGQRVVPIDLARVFGKARSLGDNDVSVAAALERLGGQTNLSIPDLATLKIAKLYVSLRSLIDEHNMVAAGHNCWTGIQEDYGISGCTTFSMLEEDGTPITCETDIYGAVTMHLLRCVAAQTGDTRRPFFMDWTIAHPTEPDVFQAWPCGKAPLSVFKDRPTVRSHEILGPIVGEDRAAGTIEGEFKTGDVTLCRVVEYGGTFRAFVGRGEVIPGQWDHMRGSWGWVRMNDMGRTYQVLVQKGFSHHVALQYGDHAGLLAAVCDELGMEVVWVD